MSVEKKHPCLNISVSSHALCKCPRSRMPLFNLLTVHWLTPEGDPGSVDTVGPNASCIDLSHRTEDVG